jgi:predicted Zn finger-like uncharacterized protein
MPQTVRCPACQTQYRVNDELAGRKAKCKKCGQGFQIPAMKQPVMAQAAHATTTTAVFDGRAATRVAARAEEPKAPPEEQPTPAKTQCPHCGAWATPGLRFCSECRLDMQKSYGVESSDRDHEMRRSLLFSLIGIVATLIAAPVFFLLAAMVVGGGLAMLLSVLLMQVGVSLGSFSLACHLFKQDAPEPGEILKVVCYSNLPASVLASWFLPGGVVGAIGATVIGMILAAVICMFYVGMPVVPSILVSVVYNIFAGILTVVWVMVLVVVFAGFMAVTQPATPAGSAPAVETSP